MIPPTPTRTGRAVAARPGRLPLVMVGAALAFAGCIGNEPSAAVSPSPSASTAVASPSTDTASPTLQPSPSSSATEGPTASPDATASPSATTSPSTGPSQPAAEAVKACTGDDKNRAFFLNASQNLDWPVYCPVLPARWFVTSGNYSGRGVGQLTIGYQGPAGATLTLQEGAFCETSDGCVPAGNDTGAAAFGDRQGTLVTLDDGGYAIVVGRADTPSWLAVATGMDEATFRQVAEGFVRLD
ncbi:MAG TPA: hypothetical protein VFN41_12540 [Candidatus Limnocylindrales bacterium]|nr:hypothetical protein [Candidatus Limnocylindrales bacterium]